MNPTFEIIHGHHQVETRTIGENVYFSQTAFVDLGAPFPQQIKIPLKSQHEAYPAGKYELDISSYRVGKYERFEINPYSIRLLPIAKPVVSTASK